MTFDPLAPFGPLIETRVRVATWNAQSRNGPRRERGQVISDVLATAEPGARLGLPHAIAETDGIVSTPNTISSRWPIVATHQALFPAADRTDPAPSDHYGVLAELRY